VCTTMRRWCSVRSRRGFLASPSISNWSKPMTLNETLIDTPGISTAEWQARVDLAALYRLFVHFGWTDLTYTHISARVPGEPEHLLLNPYGLLFEEITASNLNKMSFDGKVLSGAHGYNKAGHIIHTAILQARPEINFVIHSHTLAGAAVSAMR